MRLVKFYDNDRSPPLIITNRALGTFFIPKVKLFLSIINRNPSFEAWTQSYFNKTNWIVIQFDVVKWKYDYLRRLKYISKLIRNIWTSPSFNQIKTSLKINWSWNVNLQMEILKFSRSFLENSALLELTFGHFRTRKDGVLSECLSEEKKFYII